MSLTINGGCSPCMCLKAVGGGGELERRRLAFRLKGDTVCSDLLVSQRQHRLIFNHKAKLQELHFYIVMYFILVRDGIECSLESEGLASVMQMWFITVANIFSLLLSNLH